MIKLEENMENNTYEEVIKGVQWRADFDLRTAYLDGYQNKTLKFSDILELINHLKSENERLTEELGAKCKECREIADDYQEMGTFYYNETVKTSELQKQVDELKDEKLSAVCDLNMRIVELDNELKQAKSSLSFTESLLEFREETIKYLEDANIRYAEALENKVKDTAEKYYRKMRTALGILCFGNDKIHKENREIAKHFGVEVE